MAYPFNRLLGCGILFLFHESLISFRCIYSISTLRGLPVDIPQVLSLYIYISCHSFGKAVSFSVKRHEAISRKSYTSTYKGILCHFRVTDGSDIV